MGHISVAIQQEKIPGTIMKVTGHLATRCPEFVQVSISCKDVVSYFQGRKISRSEKNALRKKSGSHKNNVSWQFIVLRNEGFGDLWGHVVLLE